MIIHKNTKSRLILTDTVQYSSSDVPIQSRVYYYYHHVLQYERYQILIHTELRYFKTSENLVNVAGLAAVFNLFSSLDQAAPHDSTVEEDTLSDVILLKALWVRVQAIVEILRQRCLPALMADLIFSKQTVDINP